MPYTKQSWANDAAGGTKLNATRLAYIETGIETAQAAAEAAALAAVPAGRRAAYQQIQTQGSGNVLIADGTALPTATGGTVVFDGDDDGHWVRCPSTGVINTTGGYNAAATSITKRAYDFDELYKIKTYTSVADLGLWVGLSSASLDNDASPAAHIAAMRYYTGTDGTAAWRAVTKDGTTATVTATASAVAVDTVYRFRIVGSATDVKFYSYTRDGVGTLLATHTTNLPALSTALLMRVRCTALIGAAKAIRFARWYREHKA